MQVAATGQSKLPSHGWLGRRASHLPSSDGLDKPLSLYRLPAGKSSNSDVDEWPPSSSPPPIQLEAQLLHSPRRLSRYQLSMARGSCGCGSTQTSRRRRRTMSGGNCVIYHTRRRQLSTSARPKRTRCSASTQPAGRRRHHFGRRASKRSSQLTSKLVRLRKQVALGTPVGRDPSRLSDLESTRPACCSPLHVPRCLVSRRWF